nr:MAG TPA: Putative ABC-transporter type IV [Caudoviricetes sp.]
MCFWDYSEFPNNLGVFHNPIKSSNNLFKKC